MPNNKSRNTSPIRLPNKTIQRASMSVSLTAVAVLLLGCAEVKDAGNELAAGAKSLGGSIENTLDGLFGNYIDENDVCVAHRRKMVESASFFDQDTLSAIGVAAGTGVLVFIRTRSVKDSLIASGVVLAGFYLQKYIGEGRNATEVTSSVRADVVKSNQQIDQILEAFKQIDKCRRGEAEAIRADLSRNTITRVVAKERMKGVRERRQEDIDKFKELAENISDRTVAYASAYNEIAADNNRRGFEISEQGQVRKSRRKPKKQNENLALGGAKKSEIRRLERDTLTNAMKRDESFEIAANAEKSQTSYEI